MQKTGECAPCMRLLKAILLAYRPLNIAEVDSVSGLSDEWVTIKALVDRCASFLKMRGTDIEFVHQSARDYLAGKNGQSILDSHADAKERKVLVRDTGFPEPLCSGATQHHPTTTRMPSTQLTSPHWIATPRFRTRKQTLLKMPASKPQKSISRPNMAHSRSCTEDIIHRTLLKHL